ncbi:MAG: hypothetical protein HYU52_11820 [Acidobacteria bacterium]|nr:hypothetical protein [Acidobacteriota bacterium]
MSDSERTTSAGNDTSAIAAATEVRPRRDLGSSLLIGICCLMIYNSNSRAISAGDTFAARYLPFAIWRDHTVTLDSIASVTAQGRGARAFWMVKVGDGHTISLYPVVLPLLIAPLYLPAIAYLQLQGWTDARMDHVAQLMEKFSASLLAALSAALLYLLLRRRAAPPVALLLTVAYAFGTTTWVISSQALWQHGMAELLIVGALLLLTGPCTTRSALAAGLLLGLIPANRPPDLILGAALGAYGLFWAARRAPLVVVAAATPLSVVLWYNLRFAGHFAGAYGLMGRPAFLDYDLLPGLAGLMVSPARGLMVFSPFFLFLVLAWRRLPREGSDRGLALALTAGVVVQILLYAKSDWRSGASWGPRFLTDMQPMLIWLLVPVVNSMRRLGRLLFVLAVAVAVTLEAIGAFWYTDEADAALFTVPRGPHQFDPAWEWENAPFVSSLRKGLAPADLFVPMRGKFDAILADHRPTSEVAAGEEVDAAGWALADHASPLQVAVFVDGGRPLATREFFVRDDVRDALHEASPSGWRIPIDTSSLAPGEHQVTAWAWASPRGTARYLGEQTMTVRSRASSVPSKQPAAVVPQRGGDELSSAFSKAAARIREHQQAPGYWFTSHTVETRFQNPHAEMNTFLTALLVDLLDPLASAAGLDDSVQRARRHLTEQIEPGGLVRYHGLPDNRSVIGKLGCAITPDTDDTALVWRVAPGPDRRQLASALATIGQYRTTEGLYRTWLAPRERFHCIDPGSDANPPDIAIQMHLMILLAEERPREAGALCEAVRSVIDEDRIWVYYRKAPLVPILRLTDLRRIGCAVELPESRMRASVPGQEIWVEVAQMLANAKGNDARARELMRDIARDDFALLKTNPPLLYHNDLTASVSRYYWSEDAGYALWLRLHHQHANHAHPLDLSLTRH